MARSRTIWKDGQLFAEYEGDKLVYLNPSYRPPARSDAVKAPMVVRDMGEYVSPVDGSHITSRSQHRDHLRAHDLIEVGNERLKGMPEPVRPDRNLGEAIKRRIDEVAAMPQGQYDAHVQQQAAEHKAVADLVTAS